MNYEKISLTLCLLFLLFSCKGKPYIFTLDSFPPNSKPHEKNWTHIFKIVMYQDHSGGFNKYGKKEIYISIVDKDDNVLLKKNFTVFSGNIDREIKWDTFENISCKLFTYQTEGKRETFKRINQKDIIDLTYKYNAKINKFEKIGQKTYDTEIHNN